MAATPPAPRRRPLLWILGGAVALVLLVVGGTWVYINVVRDDAPERLTFTDREPDATTSETTTTEPTTTHATTADPDAAGGDVTGTWTAGDGSIAGYRVAEILFGQSVEAAGRTEEVSAVVVLDGTTLVSADVEVDMASITSDESRRDNQFRGRIMDTDTFPTARFVLAGPLDLGELPAGDDEVAVTAPGELTLRGTTRAVEAELAARRIGETIEVIGTIPVVFADFGIPNPNVPGITTEQEGLVELRLVLVR